MPQDPPTKDVKDVGEVRWFGLEFERTVIAARVKVHCRQDVLYLLLQPSGRYKTVAEHRKSDSTIHRFPHRSAIPPPGTI